VADSRRIELIGIEHSLILAPVGAAIIVFGSIMTEKPTPKPMSLYVAPVN
jgi:hypothetical protein